MTVRPLIYGYLRVWTDTSEEDAARTEAELIGYAQREGFTVAEIFVERPYLPVPAFNRPDPGHRPDRDQGHRHPRPVALLPVPRPR